MKKTIKSLGVALLAMLTVLLSSCGDDTSLPTVQFQFNTVKSATNTTGANRAMENTLAFTDGTITLRQIQFQVEAGTDSIEANVEQTVVIDFATGATTPDLSSLAIPVGTYEAVEVELELLDENNQPSVVINGTFIDGNGTSHPIRFEFNSGETFEVEKEGVVSFLESESVVAQVTFDPGVWFSGVTSEHLLSANRNSSDIIVISSTQNTDIFEIVADGLDLATEIEISTE